MEVMLRICVVVVVVLLHQSKSEGLFTPKDNYLIDCGSTRDTSVDGRTFTLDSSSSLVSSSRQNFVSATKSNTSTPVPSDLYLTARVFTQESAYTFKVQLQGRHWGYTSSITSIYLALLIGCRKEHEINKQV